MNIKILESSLNLRIERGRKKEDYFLSKSVAEKQLSFLGTDIYTNVEFMDCDNNAYLDTFKNAGYKSCISTDEKGRGILCEIKEEYGVEKISEMFEPHMLHFRMAKEKNKLDVIVFRILVSDRSQKDFVDRYRQWKKVMKYIDNAVKDKSKLVLIGDWNHAFIREEYIQGQHNQHIFNYQMIKEDLIERNIKMGIDIAPGHKEHSYMGYLAIDHIAVGNSISYVSKPYYTDYDKSAPIGVPDHAFLFANIEVQ